MQYKSPPPVDILVLGAGWTGEFLIPLLKNEGNVTFAATTREGRIVADYSTISFTVDGQSDWSKVPKSRTVVLTFPTTVNGAVSLYIQGYEKVHGSGYTRWLQLGSISIFDTSVSSDLSTRRWLTRRTPIPRPAAPRFESEFELLSLSSSSFRTSTAVLSLAGLWGGKRLVSNWVSRVAATKGALASKGSVHMVHGIDVARAILAIHRDFPSGERWVLTDGRVYDWWDLASAWGSGGSRKTPDEPISGEQPRWVLELMNEHEIFALPRPPHQLPGKLISSAEFWIKFGIAPIRARLDGAS